MIDDLVEYVKTVHWNGGTLADDPGTKGKIAEMRIDAEISRMLSYRVMWLQSVGQVPNYEASGGQGVRVGDGAESASTWRCRYWACRDS